MDSPLEQFDIINLVFLQRSLYEVSFISVIVPFLLLNFFIIMFIFFSKSRYKLIPDVWQFVAEKIYEFIFSIIKQQIGIKGFVYLPLIFILFLFVLSCNLISLVPFGIALTSHLILILFLSISLCVSIFIIGVLKQGFNFFKNFIPECPLVLIPILIPIEIFSYLIRMFSLSIRLAANILAGHTLVYIISGFILKISSLKFWFYIVVVMPLLAILVLEFGVAFLQAYVFVILVCIYLSDTLKAPGH
jgi:F-type H+-transporting ATPase subunit a